MKNLSGTFHFTYTQLGFFLQSLSPEASCGNLGRLLVAASALKKSPQLALSLSLQKPSRGFFGLGLCLWWCGGMLPARRAEEDNDYHGY